MYRVTCCVTSALLLAAVASPHADARTQRTPRDNAATVASPHANARTHRTPRAFAGAYNRASDAARPQSPTDMRQQCYEEAAKRVSSTNQDLQKVRDFVYRDCAYDHGLPP